MKTVKEVSRITGVGVSARPHHHGTRVLQNQKSKKNN